LFSALAPAERSSFRIGTEAPRGENESSASASS
jgi:hypothetical protein